MTAIDTQRLRDSAGLTADEDEARVTPGQQTLDGGEVRSDELPPPEEIYVSGTTQLGLFEAGGKTPQTASLKLKGGRAVLSDGTAFRKGERIALVVHCVIEAVSQKDSADKSTGIVTSCEQEHTARVVDFYVSDE